VNRIQQLATYAAAASVLLLAGCSKKSAKVVPPAPPAPASPTATLAANPSDIQQGQSSELTWKTSNATDVTIEGLGTVPPSGSRAVTPTSSTTYTLNARGDGGTQQASARVTVSAGQQKAAESLSDRDLFAQMVKDVYFDFNKADLRSDQNANAQKDGDFLAQHSNLKVLIEGHCDDRGSEEYNLALGDSRANSLRSTLIAQGVSPDHIKVVSYGKEHPFCSQENEECWQQNRRDHVALQ
jgi:peptidoglycan-associated lipoprotein